MTPQESVEAALACAKTDGCVVIVNESTGANLRWANSTVTTNGVSQSRQLTVIATVAKADGAAVGSVSRSGVTADRIEGLVREAEAAAQAAMPAEDSQPLVTADSALAGAADAWDDAPRTTSIAAFSTLIPSLRDAFEQARSEDRLLFGFASHSISSTYLGSSTGLRLRHDQPTGRVELNAKSPDFTRSAWLGRAAATLDGVDLVALDAELGRRLAWSNRRVDLPAGRYETLLPPTSVADLMIYLYWSAGARDAQDGRTVFSRAGGGTRVGEALSPLPVTLRSDPAAPGLECSPMAVNYSSGPARSVFDNGMALAPTTWIGDGELKALVQSRHSAALTGLATTPEVDNLILESTGAQRSITEMTAATDRGLLLTSLWYIREVDPQTLLLTGLTRDGVFLVEGGEVVAAVNNFRWNESPVDLLARASEVGGTERCLTREWSDYFNRTSMPPLRIPDFNMSSVSPAT